MAKDILAVLFTNFPCMIFHSSVENCSQCEHEWGLLHKRDLEGAVLKRSRVTYSVLLGHVYLKIWISHLYVLTRLAISHEKIIFNHGVIVLHTVLFGDHLNPKQFHYHFWKVSLHAYFWGNRGQNSYKQNNWGEPRKKKHVLLPAQKQLRWYEKIPATGNVFC